MFQKSAAESGPEDPPRTSSNPRPGPQPTHPLATSWQKLWRQILGPRPLVWHLPVDCRPCHPVIHQAPRSQSLCLPRAGSVCPAGPGSGLSHALSWKQPPVAQPPFRTGVHPAWNGTSLLPGDCWLATSPEPGSRLPGWSAGHKCLYLNLSSRGAWEPAGQEHSGAV